MSGFVMHDGRMRGRAGCIRCSCCCGGPLDADAPPASVAQTRVMSFRLAHKHNAWANLDLLDQPNTFLALRWARLSGSARRLRCPSYWSYPHTSGGCRRGRRSHLNTALDISLVIPYIKYTGSCTNDFNVHA